MFLRSGTWHRADRRIGLAIQSMERTSSPLPDTLLPHHHLHLVVDLTRIHLRVAADDELSRFWVLQLRIHDPHRGESSHRCPVLFDSV